MNDAVDAVRRKVYAQGTDLEKRNIIKGSRWLLLTRDKDLFDDDKKKRLDNILQTNTPLFHAYYLKEDLDQIWMQDNKEDAEKQVIEKLKDSDNFKGDSETKRTIFERFKNYFTA